MDLMIFLFYNLFTGYCHAVTMPTYGPVTGEGKKESCIHMWPKRFCCPDMVKKQTYFGPETDFLVREVGQKQDCHPNLQWQTVFFCELSYCLSKESFVSVPHFHFHQSLTWDSMQCSSWRAECPLGSRLWWAAVLVDSKAQRADKWQLR